MGTPSELKTGANPRHIVKAVGLNVDFAADVSALTNDLDNLFRQH